MVIIRVFFFIAFGTSIIFAQCDSIKANLNCLKSNFEELYEKNYDLFWKILRQAGNTALANSQKSTIVDFLDVASSIKGNSEVGEYFSEVAESLVVTVPDTFISAAAALADSSDVEYVLSVLKEPTFHSPDKIQKVLEKQRSIDKKKMKFLEEFFKQSQNKEKK